MQLCRRLTRKRLVVKQRRYERVYKRIADLNVTFYEKGAATKHMKNDHLKSGRFDCSVVCCDVVEMTGDSRYAPYLLVHPNSLSFGTGLRN